MKVSLLAAAMVVVLAGCASSEADVAKSLLPVGEDIAYNAEQVYAICRSEALNTRSAVRANRPSQVVVNTAPSGGSFMRGFAESFNRGLNSGPSGFEEGKAAFAACAARHGYVIR